MSGSARTWTAATAVLVLGSLLAACASPAPTPAVYQVQPGAHFVLQGVSNVKQVARLIGADSINKTDRYGVAGADLGSMINMGDQTYFVFGDTFGRRPPGMTGGGGDDWRSNVMAVTSDTDPSDGITFDHFIADASNHAVELIPGAKQDGVEMTRIPTYGVAVGQTLYLYFMSVRHWGPAGLWDANFGGVARSTDAGAHWTDLPDLRWDGTSNFVQVSTYAIRNADGTTDLYFWGIPAGRFGGVKLMKVPETEIEHLTGYRYFAGTDSSGAPRWVADQGQAPLVVNDTVGELSVVWNPYLSRWLMTYLRGGGNIVIREGLNPWGPWGEPIDLVTQAGFPGLYGPYMNPKYVGDGGQTIYFCLSQWGPYAVFWWKATLVKGN